MSVETTQTGLGAYNITIKNYKADAVKSDTVKCFYDSANTSSIEDLDLTLDPEIAEGAGEISVNVGYYAQSEKEGTVAVSREEALGIEEGTNGVLENLTFGPGYEEKNSSIAEVGKDSKYNSRAYFKSSIVVYKQHSFFPSDYFICDGFMKWIKDPATKAFDILAFNWTNAAAKVSSYDLTRNCGEMYAYANYFDQNVTRKATNSFKNNRIQFIYSLGPEMINLRGCELSKFSMVGRVVLKVDGDWFDFMMSYAHQKIGLTQPTFSISNSGAGISIGATKSIDTFSPSGIRIYK